MTAVELFIKNLSSYIREFPGAQLVPAQDEKSVQLVLPLWLVDENDIIKQSFEANLFLEEDKNLPPQIPSSIPVDLKQPINDAAKIIYFIFKSIQDMRFPARKLISQDFCYQIYDDRHWSIYPMLAVQLARAVFSFTAESQNELSFVEGDNFIVLDHRDNGWILVQNTETAEKGCVPESYLEFITKSVVK